MPLLFLLIILWFSYLLLEAYLNRKYLASFRAVIHVNGIRGKTSTCRAIDAALRTRYRVFTKTTGTDAAMIDVSGKEHPVRRLGPANIHEQLRIIRRAHKEGAEILILECMAVNPVLQKTVQEQIVRGSICVITNVRYDHVFEMGDTKEEIASALSAVIPEHGVLVTADPLGETYFGDACRRKGTELVLCLPDENEAGTAAENELIARAVSRRLGITEEEFLRSRSRVQEDFGVRRIYDVTTSEGIPCRFLNLFSANDPESTYTNLEDVLGHEKLPPAVQGKARPEYLWSFCTTTGRTVRTVRSSSPVILSRSTRGSRCISPVRVQRLQGGCSGKQARGMSAFSGNRM